MLVNIEEEGQPSNANIMSASLSERDKENKSLELADPARSVGRKLFTFCKNEGSDKEMGFQGLKLSVQSGSVKWGRRSDSLMVSQDSLASRR
jgi:hypothetical protein